ncbi:MAG: OmpA family protein [Fluviicoccus sp.]|uniref:OmpA family protein n=1 Tax=Fluviicoccus sp. TaxID=2003552 RepID=UPI0027212807|nr:OmpA family protein [Fluviicoccus sp.]MDO8332091.1 OmpA family protein [Fluviicoccus sp.]
MSRIHALALGVSLIAVAGSAVAGVITVSPMAGYHVFDGDTRPDLTTPAKGMQDDGQYSLGLGYRFNPAFGIEALVARVKTNEETPFGNVRATATPQSLDALYRFNADSTLSPFVLAGVGRNIYKADNGPGSFSNGFGEVGGGLLWKVADRLSLRTEARYQHEPGKSWNNWIAQAGVEIGFGSFAAKNEDSAPVTMAEPAPQQVAVAPAAPVAPVVLDDDRDGVNNDRDTCANTPAGAAVDAKGCPLDSDHDGVADYKDKCPDSKAGAVVDDKGCYVVLKNSESINLNVLFATGKSVILGDAGAELAKVADFMKKYPDANVAIEGHTDSRGQAAKNQTLSQQRAEAVREALVKLGVDGARLKAVGYGSTQPVADNKTEEGRAKNRRVVATAKGESETIKMKK